MGRAQQDLITHAILHGAMTSVISTPLILLSPSNRLPGPTYQLLRTCNNILGCGNPVATVEVINNLTDRLPVNHLKGRDARRSTRAGVQRELNQAQQLMPSTASLHQERPQHLLNHPMGPLSLAIRLRVVSGTECQASPDNLHQCTPEGASPPGITIRHDLLGDTEVTHHTVKENRGSLLSSQPRLLHWCKAHQLRKAVHTRIDPVEATTLRQVCDEIHAPASKPRLRHL